MGGSYVVYQGKLLVKKIVTLFMFCISTLFSSIHWYGYKEALEIQKINSKIIMINVFRENCKYCVLMDKTFEEEELTDWINEHFIAVKVDAKSCLNDINLNVKMTPSFLFIDKNKKIIKTISGSWSKEDFIDLTKNITRD